ncbi:MAG TPA: DUF6049 family protein [Acidimicrobiales bacterium]|nr:DUF6049 family protein [Acidimicrobiales bacterium]
MSQAGRCVRLRAGAVLAMLAAAWSAAWSAWAAPAAVGASPLPLAAGRGPASAGSTSATTPTAPSAGPLVLADQTSWTPSGSVFTARVALAPSAPRSGLQLAVEVYSRLLTRSAFDQSIAGHQIGYPLWVQHLPLNQLPADPAGGWSICLPVDRAALSCPQAPVVTGSVAGVYPVEIALQSSAGSVLGRLETELVETPSSPGSKLDVALVVQVAAPEPIGPDGSRRLPAATVTALSQVTAGLAARGPVPVTLEPDPATLVALAGGSSEGRAVLAGLRRLAPDTQVLARPLAPVSATDLVDSGLDGDLSTQLVRGAAVDQAQLGLTPSPATWVVDGALDRSGLAALAQLGVERLILPPDDLTPVFTPITPAQPYLVSGQSGRVPAVLTDQGLSSYFRPGDPVLAAHQLLGELAQVYFDRPGLARGVVVQTPRSWPASRDMLSLLGRDLSSSPVLAPVTVDDVLATVSPNPRLRSLPFSPVHASLPAGRIRRDAGQLSSLEGAAVKPLPAGPTIGDLVMASEAAGMPNRTRLSYLQGAERLFAAQLEMIQVPRGGLTVTSRTTHIPVTVVSGLSVPLRLQMRLRSDQLIFPAGTTYDIELTQRNYTKLVDIETRGSGSFPMDIQLLSPDGQLSIVSSRFTIHSTAVSSVGIILSGGAVLFLAVWWGRVLIAGRRQRNPRLVEH